MHRRGELGNEGRGPSGPLNTPEWNTLTRKILILNGASPTRSACDLRGDFLVLHRIPPRRRWRTRSANARHTNASWFGRTFALYRCDARGCRGATRPRMQHRANSAFRRIRAPGGRRVLLLPDVMTMPLRR